MTDPTTVWFAKSLDAFVAQRRAFGCCAQQPNLHTSTATTSTERHIRTPRTPQTTHNRPHRLNHDRTHWITRVTNHYVFGRIGVSTSS